MYILHQLFSIFCVQVVNISINVSNRIFSSLHLICIVADRKMAEAGLTNRADDDNCGSQQIKERPNHLHQPSSKILQLLVLWGNGHKVYRFEDRNYLGSWTSEPKSHFFSLLPVSKQKVSQFTLSIKIKGMYAKFLLDRVNLLLPIQT